MSTLLSNPPPPPAAGEDLTALMRRLADADRILQKERGATGFLRLWPWVCGAVIGTLAADVALHLESTPRLAISLGLLISLLICTWWYAWTAWRKINSSEHTARVLESRDPRLGSRIINALQLRAQSVDPQLSPVTRRMAEHAVAGCGRELQHEDLTGLARTGQVRKEGKRAAIGLSALVVVLLLAFDVTRVELPRFLDPFGDHPPYSFTRLEITEPLTDGTSVVYGQNVIVSAQATGHRPGELFLTYHPVDKPQETHTVPMFDKGERGFWQQIEQLRSDTIVYVHTRTRHAVSKQRRVGVILTPKLDRAFVKITPPTYTQQVGEERPLQFKAIKALAGSTIQFRLQSNRPLHDGRIDIVGAPEPAPAATLTASGENEVSGTLEAKESAKLRFSIVDTDGYRSDEVWELSLNVTQDLGPTIQITTPSGDSFVAEDYRVDGIVEASDDYGLKTVRIHRGRNDDWEEPRTITYDQVVRNAREGFGLDFKDLGVKAGDTITLFAEAIDSAPTPHVARTPVLTLRVISTEEYNTYLREQLDIADVEKKYAELINKLHDLGDEQRKLGEQIDAAKQQLADAKDPTAAAAKLDELLARQNEVNAKLNKLADVMDTFVRDQPVYDIEAELREKLQEKAEQIRQSTAQNDKAGHDVAQRSSKPSGERQLDPQMLADLKSASDQQLERLGLTEQQARDEVTAPLEDMSLMHELVKDMNRFRDLYEAQRNLAQQVKALDRPAPLSREDQLALKALASEQKQIGDELSAVEQKLRDDSAAAAEKFPKASRSAEDLADRMNDVRLSALASQATDAMLAGKGDDGSQLASRLQGQMEKLIAECNSQGGQMSDELDQYLSLSRGMSAGNSFKQMMQSRKFGGNKPGGGSSSGTTGPSGKSGFAIQSGPNTSVLGNETAISNSSAQQSKKGLSQAVNSEPAPTAALDQPQTVQGVNAINRESGAVQSEGTIEQYSEIVEKYFKAISK